MLWTFAQTDGNVCCYQEVQHMNKLLKNLYECFYIPPELPAQKQEIEECHQALINVLDKPERRLVLQIIDAKDRIVEDTSIDSFIYVKPMTKIYSAKAEIPNYQSIDSPGFLLFVYCLSI